MKLTNSTLYKGRPRQTQWDGVRAYKKLVFSTEHTLGPSRKEIKTAIG